MTVEIKPPAAPAKRSFLLTAEQRARLAQRLRDEGMEAPARPAIPRRSGTGPAPLSFPQQRLWFLHQLDPASTAYTIAQAMRVAGPLSPALLEAALGEVVRRHEALRTVFFLQDGQPVQEAVPVMGHALPVVDLSVLPAARREDEARRAAGSLVAVPFDLEHGPLLRSAFFTLAAEDRVLLLSMHHIVSDGWSIGVLMREVAALCESFAAGSPPPLQPLQPLPLQIADYAVWQRGELAGKALESRLAWWRTRLAGCSGVLDLPTDHPRPPVQGFHGWRIPLSLGRGPVETLRATALAARATPFMLLTAALQALLHRYSGQDDVVVGAPVANRELPEVAGLIGPFLNTLVLRGDLSGDPPFREFLARTRDTVLDAEAHQDLPFELLVDDLRLERDLSRNPLFQVLLAYQNLPLPQLPGAGVTLSSFELAGGGTQLDLSLNLAETSDGLAGVLQARTDLFDAPTAARMAGHFRRLLMGLTEAPESRLSELPLLSAAERFQVLEEWNDTAAVYCRGGGDLVLHRLIEAQVARTPEAVAVVFEGESLDYRTLDRRANQLAHRLRALGCGPESPVGVHLERSLEMIVALLGILKAGGAYLPLDPEYPPDRLVFMLESSGAEVLLTQAHLMDTLPEHHTQILVLDVLEGGWDEIARESAEPLHLEIEPESPAYIIYTSGSTGRPKGVLVPHSGVVNRLLWMQDAYRLTAEDRVLQKTPFSFDVSVWELFWPLLTGARLVFARPGGHRDAAYLVRLIQEQEITTLHFVPSMLQVFLEEPVEECRSLRRVFCSGEALPRDLQDRFLTRLGAPARVKLHNLYGPTEASIDVTFWACGSTARPGVPIGRPIANTRILLLDRSLWPVPIGVPGELCIGGTGLARGYLGRPDLTAERFVPDPFAARPGERLYRTGDLTRSAADGAIEYLGRLDHQVKVRGFRIELGEIEAALVAHPRVREAVVTARDGRNGRGQEDRRLVAYLVADAEGLPPIDELRLALGARLPDYMVPAVFVALESFPLTSSGKVDRKALPEPGADRPGLEQPFVAPTTPREAAWAEIWREVLGIDRVGIHDNFFALGGDSIRSIQVLARARERGLSATVQQIFQRQTIHGLLEAQAIEPGVPAVEIPPFGLLAPGERERLPAGIEDAYPLALLQAGMLFHSEYSPDTAVFQDVFGFHVRSPLDLEALQGAIQELAIRHAILRTSFRLTGHGEPLQLVHPEVEIPVEVTDLRSMAPAAQRAALKAWIEEERRQGYNYASPPLVRFHVHPRSDDSFQLTLSFHHAILDGWSVASLFAELFQRYAFRLGRGSGPAPELCSTYRDFVALEREALASPEQREFWQRDLAGRTATLLPRWPRPVGEGVRRVHKHLVPLSVGVSEGLLRLASSLGVPVKSALLAAHLRVLQLLTGQADLTTGLVTNGRPEERDGERVLGLFLNTLPFRQELRGGTWKELIRQTFAAERERLAFRRFPVAEIQRMLGGQPLFETVFNFISFHVYASTAGLTDLEVVDVEVVEETNFPLGTNFQLHPVSSRLQLFLDCDTAELRPEQVEALAGYYARTLAAMATTPDGRFEEALLLAPEEIQLLETEANDTQAAGRFDLCIHRLFEEQAARSPAETALILGDQRLTYGELNAWANRLARRLRDLGVGPETVVGLCAERSLEAIAGILGVLKAGGAYLPLDPAYPPERLSFLLEDARVPVLLCQERLLGRLPAHGARIVLLDAAENAAAPEERETQNLGGGATPLHPVYVIYTSGSTGVPKGVAVPHAGLANFALAMAEQMRLGPSHRVLEFASLSFDASAVQIFPTLISGAALVLHPDPTGLSSHEILRLCEQHGVTVLDLPAALWRQFVEDVSADGFGSAPLSVFMTGGESVTVARLRSWADAAPPGSLFLSSYGPTEATVTTTLFAVTREQVDDLDGRVIPLGRRLPNVRVHLLDRHLQTVPLAVPGEICIGGAGITRGYLGRPDLTAQAFTPDPFAGEPGARLYRTGDMARRLWDGRLEFLGRFDHQVKIRGFRVEPGEIEAVLATCPEVAHAAVVIREDTPGDLRLIAYVVPQPEQELDLRTLRTMLQGKLPPHMVPAAFVVLDALPVTANGKLDRQALPSPEGAGPGGDRPYRAPRTSVEQSLAQVWSEVLRVERAGLDDSFFELGGHSLIAVQMIGRLRETFQVDIPLRTLFEAATLVELAEAIERLKAGGAEAAMTPFEPPPPLVPDPAGHFLPFPLTPVQQAYWAGQGELFELGGAGSNVYNEVEVSGLLGVFLARLKAALPRWVEHHDVLRSIILPDGRQQILERVPRYVPEIVDLRGLDPWEVRDRLEVARERLRFTQVVAGEWPPFEIAVFRLGGGRLRICARISALILDGTSRTLLMEDLYRLVNDPHAPFPPLDVSFRDYALAREALRDTEAGRRSRERWMKRLPGLPPAPDLPRVREGRLPVRPRFVIRDLELLDAGAWERLRSRAARAGLTSTGVVLAAFVDTVAFFSRTPRFTLSLVGTERFPLHPQVGEIIGNFNTIHLLEVDGWDGPFETRARRLRDRLASDMELPFFSGLEVLRELNRLHGNRYGAAMPVLFNSVIEHNDSRDEDSENSAGTPEPGADDSVEVRDVEINIYAPQILLSPTVMESGDGGLLCKWQAVEDAFPPGLVSEMAVAFEHRLRALADLEESWHAAPAARPEPPEALERMAPRDAEEEEVAALWRDLLGTGDFGIRDDFFAVGGDSFGIARLVSRLQERILAKEPAPRPGLWRRLSNRFARWRGAAPDGDVAAARSLLRERLMAAFVQEPTVENLAAVVRRERAARAAEATELAPAALDAGVRTFTWIWLGQVVSMLGSAVGSFAIGLWVYRTTGSVTEFALISVFAALSGLALSPLAGTLIDRWDRRRVMLTSDAISACCTLALVTLLLTDRLQVWHVYILVAALSTAASFQGPAFLASVSLLVPRSFLGRANGMAQLGSAFTQTVAPMLAGALLIAIDLEGIIAIDLATFVFGAAMVLRVAIPRPATEPGDRGLGWRSLLHDSAQGWRYVRERPGLLGLLGLLAAANLSLGMVQVLVTPLVLSFASAAMLGTVLSVSGMGMVAGSLAMTIWGGPRRRVRTMLGLFLVEGVLLIVGGLRPNVIFVGLAALVFLACHPIINGSNLVIWQRKVPPELQGRVFSLQRMVTMSALPIAFAAAGPLADRVFEPLLAEGGALAGTVGRVLGTGDGRGIGLMFQLLGLALILTALVGWLYPRLRNLERELPDASREAGRTRE